MNQDPRQGPYAAPIGWPRLSEGNLLDLRGPPLAGPSDARSGCPRSRSPTSSTAWLPSNRRPRRRQRLVAKERRMPVRSPHPDVDIPACRPRDVPLRQGSRRTRGRARVRRRGHRRGAHVRASCTSRSSGSRRRSRSGGSGAATWSRCTRRTPRPGRPSSTASCAPTRRSPASTRSTPPASWPPSSPTPGPGCSSRSRPCWSGREAALEGGRARRRRRGRPGRRGRLTPASTTCSPATEPPPAPAVGPDDLAVLPYSSGTTGRAKGVMLTHRNLVANLRQFAACSPVDAEGTRPVAVLPFFHIYGMTVDPEPGHQPARDRRHPAAVRPGRVPPGDRRVPGAAGLVAPPIMVALAKHPAVDAYDLSSVELVFSGAAPLDAGICATLARRSVAGWHRATA